MLNTYTFWVVFLLIMPLESLLASHSPNDADSVQLECPFYLSSSYIHVGSGRFDDVRRTLDSDLNTRVVLPSSKDQWLGYLLKGRSQLDKVLVYLPEKSAIADIWDSDHTTTLQERINNIEVFSREIVPHTFYDTVLFQSDYGYGNNLQWQTTEPSFKLDELFSRNSAQGYKGDIKKQDDFGLIPPIPPHLNWGSWFTNERYTDQWYTDQWYTDQWYTDQWYRDQWYTDQWYTDQWYTDQWYRDGYEPFFDDSYQNTLGYASFNSPVTFSPLKRTFPWTFPKQGSTEPTQAQKFGGTWTTTHNVTWTEVRTVCNLTLARNFSLHGDNLIFENSPSSSPTNSGEEPEYTDTNTGGSNQDTRSGMRGAVLEFDCGGVETESVFVRSTDTGEDMEILETEFLGRPISETPSELVQVGKIQREEATVVPHVYSQHVHQIPISKDLDAYIIIYRENIQYLTEDVEFDFRNFEIKFHESLELTSWQYTFFLVVYPIERSISFGTRCRSHPPETHWYFPDNSVCDGTKTEHQYNTWGLHITRTGIRVLCDGVELFKLAWADCYSPRRDGYNHFKVIEVEELGFSGVGFLGAGVYYLGELAQGVEEEDDVLELGIELGCVIMGQQIWDMCPERYNFFNRDTGRVKEEAQFLYDQILHEFNSSLAREALLIGMTREKRMSAEAAWMRDKYPVLLEETWKNWREQEEWLEYAEEEKLTILKDTQRELKFWELEELKKAFASAVKFYEEMDELLKETIGTFANSTTLIGLMEPIQEAMNMILDGLTEDKAEDYTTSAPPLPYHYISYQIIPSASSSSSPVQDEEFDIIRLSVEDEPPQDGELDIGRENDQKEEEIPLNKYGEITHFINFPKEHQDAGFEYVKVFSEEEIEIKRKKEARRAKKRARKLSAGDAPFAA